MIKQLEYSYLTLPNNFYSLAKPDWGVAPKVVLLNDMLAEELGISLKKSEEYIDFIFNKELEAAPTFAQAYAGHQFGYFTMLGDGRAIMLGEYITPDKKRLDIQIKGAGNTIYSRRGDGKATFKSMLREFLISEAMHYLNIPTSRSLAIIKTGEPVFRETIHEGALLIRIMQSHIRVGTFEFARYFLKTEDLQALLTYVLRRLYPDLEKSENPALSLLQKVMEKQIEVVTHWMRVGFIHGVMNTDNVAISGETFDYGPCAFMNTYNPNTVFSSIDTYGRYAFLNQPKILKWNLVKFAEALLPLIHHNTQRAVHQAQEVIDSFDDLWNEKYYCMMLNKLGIPFYQPSLTKLVDNLLAIMFKNQLDYNNTFLALSQVIPGMDILKLPDLQSWLEQWKYIIDNTVSFLEAQNLMKRNNPVYIPRNHLVEKALEETIHGDETFFKEFLIILKNPYDYSSPQKLFISSPDKHFDNTYQTFCGT